MTDTTYEEVRRCPRCDQPGDEKAGGRLLGMERGSSSRIFTCRNKRCKWNDTSWIVQVRRDGTFPPALTKRPKQFPPLPYNATLADSLDTLQYFTTQQGAEIRGW